MGKDMSQDLDKDHLKTDALKSLNARKIILPTLLGMAVVMYMFFSQSELDIDKIKEGIASAHIGWIVAAFITLILRDLVYMYRIRHIVLGRLKWWSSFYVIMLWEFASAVTPSVVGGTAAAVFILNREKVKLGDSIAYVILTSLFDNLFFVLLTLCIFLFGPAHVFPEGSGELSISGAASLKTLFAISVSLISLYIFIMLWGLFIKPRSFRNLFYRLSNTKLLGRWKSSLQKTGEDVYSSSKIITNRPIAYWLRIALSTVVVWFMRYFMLNCVIAAFSSNPISVFEHILIISREALMWIIMLVSPTPGSTGTAEYFFSIFYKDFFYISSLTIVVALFWRLFTYYLYLVLGALVLTRWLNKTIRD